MKWFIKCFKQYADFTGRARRKEYWWFTLINAVISAVLITGWLVPIVKMAFNAASGETTPDEWEIARIILSNPFLYIYMVYYLAVLIPSLSVTVRRLHDIGKSGYWLFLQIGASLLISLANLYTGTNTAVAMTLSFIAVAISILFLVWTFTDSQPGENKWGPNPKEPQTTEIQ